MYLLLLCLLNLCVQPSNVHEFHVSKCIVKYSESDTSLQVSLHIFIDDLEKVLMEQGAKELYLCTDREIEGADDLVSSYLNKSLQFYLDGQRLEMQYLGKEISSDLAAVWCYLEIPIPSKKGLLQLTNKILLETFDDQRNITSIQLSKTVKEHFMFEQGADTASISFQ